ncbi:hypothetical protein M1523_01970 [Patescibacteria group bacterium]|nr:hypothetical protein [Patescibacteria group bacterium]
MTKNNQQIKALVIARLETMPDNFAVSIGKQGSFKKKELIKHVKRADPIGKKIMQVELTYLRSLKTITESSLTHG